MVSEDCHNIMLTKYLHLFKTKSSDKDLKMFQLFQHYGNYRTSVVQSDHDVIKDREKPLKTDSHLDTKIYLLLASGLFLQIYVSNDIYHYSLSAIFNISQ